MIYGDYVMPHAWQRYYFLVYTLVEYLFLAYLIFTAITKKVLKFIVLFFSVGFIIFQLGFDLGANELDSISIGIETILLFIYIIFFLL
jgi:hypothetical protein